MRQTPDIHLQEMPHVPQVAVQINDPPCHLVGVTHIVGTRRRGLRQIGIFIRGGPSTQPAHLHIEVVPAGIEPVESLLFGRRHQAQRCDGDLDVVAAVSGPGGCLPVELRQGSNPDAAAT